jgi:hypothetical protein
MNIPTVSFACSTGGPILFGHRGEELACQGVRSGFPEGHDSRFNRRPRGRRAGLHDMLRRLSNRESDAHKK